MIGDTVHRGPQFAALSLAIRHRCAAGHAIAVRAAAGPRGDRAHHHGAAFSDEQPGAKLRLAPTG